MKPISCIALTIVSAGTASAHPAILDVFCLKALKEPLVGYFSDYMTEEELRLDTDARLDLILEHAAMQSVQIDSDKEKELLISVPFRSERAGGHVVVMDHDRKDGWKCLGILFGGHAKAGQELHNGYFDLSTAHNLGGGNYVVYTHCFKEGRYGRTNSERKKLEGH